MRGSPPSMPPTNPPKPFPGSGGVSDPKPPAKGDKADRDLRVHALYAAVQVGSGDVMIRAKRYERYLRTGE